MKKLLALTLLVVSISCVAEPLPPQKDQSLAELLYNLVELNGLPQQPGPYQIRLFTTTDVLGECGGTVESCPNVHFYIVIADDGLGGTPALYILPRAKGWKFDKWLGTGSLTDQEDQEGFRVETTIPDANISAEEYKAWKPQVYDVWVSPKGATFTVK